MSAHSTPDSGGFALNPGSVVQITDETPGRGGWLGAFVLVTKVAPWGVQGYVHCIVDHDTQTRAYIRVEHGQYEYIGESAMAPEGVAAPSEQSR
jgi:hypothetical protein